MSPLEDEIRETLRSEAGRLREMRPLHLPSREAPEAPALTSARRARWVRSWLAPVAAMAVVVLVAAALVAVRSLEDEPSPASAVTPVASSTPIASGSPVAGPAAAGIPRYYVQLGWDRVTVSWAIITGDEQTGKTLATYPLSKGGSLFSGAVTGAADNRTFVVSADPSRNVAGPPTFYLVRITPGAASPVQVTKLPLAYPAGDGVRQLGVSADGAELAVVSRTRSAHVPLALQVFSVATGQLQRSWSTGLEDSGGMDGPVAGLSWVGDRTLGFTVTRSPEVREEVRSLDINQAGPNLMADSRLVWSQYVPAAPHGDVHGAHACDTPTLTGDGRAVVCANGSYSPSTKRMTAVWLAYPLATPTRPRVIGSITEPPPVSNFDGPVRVDWVNAPGTAVIGSWNTSAGVTRNGVPATEVLNYQGVIRNGVVKPFPHALGAPPTAW